MTVRLPALVSFLALLFASPASAGTLSGVRFADRVEVAHKSLSLNGMALRTATVFNVKVYVAGLYLETRSSDASRILRSRETKRIELQFLRDIDRDQIKKAWIVALKGRDARDVRPLEARIEQLVARIPDAKRGDRVTLDFVPGGVQMALPHGNPVLIPGADFARALLSIWLGSKPLNGDLKDGLLGR
jgi:hypothetical protein